jgi:ubiquinone/menaquinone biosynthesis C-methylase UbiE
MRIFKTPPYRNVRELLDVPGEANEHDLQQTLRDIRRANIFGLGTWVVTHHLDELLREVPREQPLQILDVATGSADIPEELCRWAEREGRTVEITATDISPEILNVARQRILDAGFADRVRLLACDATSIPFADRHFDVVVCSLALHHLDVDSARLAFGEMARLSKVGFIVNDIYRSQGAWLMARFLTLVTTTNRLTKHDGPASVYRAFTPAEVGRIAQDARTDVTVHTHPFWRVAAVGRSR